MLHSYKAEKLPDALFPNKSAWNHSGNSKLDASLLGTFWMDSLSCDFVFVGNTSTLYSSLKGLVMTIMQYLLTLEQLKILS